MSRQSVRQRWCSLVLLGVWLSLLIYYGLPGMAFRIGRAIEAGRLEMAARAIPATAVARFPDERSAIFTRASRDVRPAVVRINALRLSAGDDEDRLAETDSDDLSPWPGGIATGCGVIVDPRGLVVTSRRVVFGAGEIRIYLARERNPFTARIAGSDPATDLAVLKFDPPADLPVANLRDVPPPRTGDCVVAVGNAYQPGTFLWVGLVNSCGSPDTPAVCDLNNGIHTTAVNALNCGGPLVNLQGAIVGIGTALGEEDDMLVGLAVPAATARRVVEQLRRQGQVDQGWLGLFVHKVEPLTEPDLHGEFSEAPAFAIDHVVPDSPAEQGGLLAGDVIFEFAGRPFNSPAELQRRIAASPPHSPITLTVLRDGAVLDRQVVVGRPPAVAPRLPGEIEWGIRLVGELSSDEVRLMGRNHLPGVVVQRVAQRRKSGKLSAGDVILAVNGVPTPNLAAYCREVSRALAAQPESAVTLAIASGGEHREIVAGR